MKKWLLITVLLLAGGAAYLYFGEPPAALMNEVKQHLPAAVPNTTTVYQWRDAEGNWQLTGTPPAAGVPYKKHQYRSDTNLVPAEALTGKRND